MTKDPHTMTQRTPPYKDIAETFLAVSETRNASAAPPMQTPPQTPASPPSIGVDTAYYQRFLDDYDIPDEQKRELIEALWAIIVQFIDLGFGVHPVEAVQDQSQTDETLRALKAVAREYASETLNDHRAPDPVLVEELVIADHHATPPHSKNTTQTDRSKR